MKNIILTLSLLHLCVSCQSPLETLKRLQQDIFKKKSDHHSLSTSTKEPIKVKINPPCMRGGIFDPKNKVKLHHEIVEEILQELHPATFERNKFWSSLPEETKNKLNFQLNHALLDEKISLNAYRGLALYVDALLRGGDLGEEFFMYTKVGEHFVFKTTAPAKDPSPQTDHILSCQDRDNKVYAVSLDGVVTMDTLQEAWRCKAQGQEFEFHLYDQSAMFEIGGDIIKLPRSALTRKQTDFLTTKVTYTVDDDRLVLKLKIVNGKRAKIQLRSFRGDIDGDGSCELKRQR